MGLLRVGRELVARIHPERGGRVVSLRGRDGREWLAQPADSAFPPPRGNARFTESDPAGWDECAPSIDACQVGDAAIPDHGDLWTAPWRVIEADRRTIELSVDGTSLGYRLTRRISSTPHGLKFEYSAASTGTPVPFLWAAHPLFRSPPGATIELPAGVDEVIDVLDPAQSTLSWSPELATVDSLRTGACRKLYVPPRSPVESATLRHADGAALTMAWQGCPYLGLWFDKGRFSKEPVVAIEPTLGFRDSLAWAIEHGDAPILQGSKVLTWSLELSVSAAP